MINIGCDRINDNFLEKSIKLTYNLISDFKFKNK
jgi:hypothetical protein